jgi:hypothetical protein
MISDVLSLIDKLLNWAQRASDREKELFQTHVQDIFNELVLIHKDYRKQIHRAIIKASRNEIDEQFFNDVVENKIALEPIRMKIHSLGILAKTDDKLPIEIRNFLLACAKYLNVFFHQRKPHFGRSDKEFDYEYSEKRRVPDQDNLEECYSAMYSGLIECLEAYGADKDIELLKNRISNINQLLLDRWSDISIAYSSARLTILR